MHRAGGRVRRPAVCFLHGFTGDKTEEGRLFVLAGRALADAGLHVLRFDYRGNGDSDGDFDDMTLVSTVEDARAALRFLRRAPGVDGKRIALVGLSLGSVVAQLIAARERAAALVLWATITRPGDVFTDELEAQAQARGFASGEEFQRQIREADPLMPLGMYRGRLLCVHGERDFVAESQPQAALAVVPGILHVVHGADHAFGPPAAKREAIDVTLRFLQQVLQPEPRAGRSARSATTRARPSRP
jgi:pimeloyl-ACP methyl ester carboxylesterase